MASFTAVCATGNRIMEAIRLRRGLTGQAAPALPVGMLARAGLSNPAARIDQYRHALSGGMRQRAMIALAFSAGPRLLTAVPEPDHVFRPERLEGESPDPAAVPSGCRFHTRCGFAKHRCRVDSAARREAAPEHRVACHYAEDFDFSRPEPA